MSGPSVHELLGLPSDVTHPNAYEVFGLALGEADQQVIRGAIGRRVSTIKQAKSSSDPDVWMQAVRAVQKAQKVLVDPERKAALDAKYGILNEQDGNAQHISPAVDPLAALLPGSQSSAAAHSAAAHSAAAHSAAPHESASLPRQSETLSTTATMPVAAPSNTTVPAAIPSVQVSSPRRARYQRGSGGVIFGSLVVVMLGLIVAGLGYLFLNGGNFQVVKSRDGFQINSGSSVTRPSGSRVATPQNARGDGVLNPPQPARSSPTLRLSPAPKMSGPPSLPGRNDQDERDATTDAPPITPSVLTSDPPAANVAETDTPPTPTPVPSPPPGPTADQVAAGDFAIKIAREAITSADWANMKSLSETAEKTAVTDEQEQAAKTLYQFADLATHYRSGVQKAMSELVAGNEFKLTDSMTFLVQKSNAQQITLYRNKREYSYTLDDLPLSVANALAPFGMDVSSPEGKAAEAVFQVISPKTTAGHRAQSIEILRGLSTVPRADPQRLADFIASLGSP